MQFIPGSIVRVWSNRFLCFHWGVIDSPEAFTGAVRVIHSSKGSFVRTTYLSEFAEGNQVEIAWVPSDDSQQLTMLQRMHAQDGQPYRLFAANCEDAVNLALTGKAHSPTIALVVLSCLAIGAIGLLSSGRA
jgi:hypothetical protein